MIEIFPDKLQSFANKHRNDTFCLITTPSLRNRFLLRSSKYYKVLQQHVCEEGDKIENILKNIPSDADIFFLPYQYHTDPPILSKKIIKPNQRVAIMGCLPKTPILIEDIDYFLKIMYLNSNQFLLTTSDHFSLPVFHHIISDVFAIILKF
jgi:hypothetical protein